MALDTLAAVRKEMAKCYRLTLANRLPSAEMARLVFALGQIRNVLEAEANSKVIDMSFAATSVTINVLAVPRAVFLDKDLLADPARLIEHATPLEPFAPSPGFDALPQLPPPLEAEPLEVTEPVDDGKVVTLRRRDDV